jgi:RNA polymerase-binding protein DksA
MTATAPREGSPEDLDAATIAALRTELEADRRTLNEQITRLDAEFDEESRTRPTSDDEVDTGSATSERERTMSLARHARAQLQLTEAALERVERGTFGGCTSCGSQIPVARLEARPQSELCVDCQRAAEIGR